MVRTIHSNQIVQGVLVALMPLRTPEGERNNSRERICEGNRLIPLWSGGFADLGVFRKTMG
jgi:hypothetical protein